MTETKKAKSNAQRQSEHYRRQRANLSKTVVKSCVMCGSTYSRDRGFGAGASKYCSPKCRQKGLELGKIEERRKRQEQVEKRTKPCLNCGKLFPHRSQKSTKYCCKECMREHRGYPVSMCVVCGNEYRQKSKYEKGKCCSVKCRDLYTRWSNQIAKRQAGATRDIRECKRKALKRHRQKIKRNECAKRLRAFKHNRSSVETARIFGDSESDCNSLLMLSNAYKRAQQKKRDESKWRKMEVSVRAHSAIYRTEQCLSNAACESLTKAGCPYKTEVPVSSTSNRRIDIVANIGMVKYGIECKNTNRTARADQCLGQSLVKCHYLEARPVCLFPSDAMPDEAFTAAATAMGVIVCNELNVAQVLDSKAFESPNGSLRG